MKVEYILLLLVGYITFCSGQGVPPNCIAVICPPTICPIPIYPSGACCPKCNEDCSVRLCGLLKCPRSQQYYQPGDCCPRCKPVEKPGTCPQFRIGHCAEICSSDNDCPRQQKCCSIGCGRDCVDPLPDKPDCSFVTCPQIRCQYGSYTPTGQCCPRCRPRPNTGYGRRG